MFKISVIAHFGADTAIRFSVTSFVDLAIVKNMIKDRKGTVESVEFYQDIYDPIPVATARLVIDKHPFWFANHISVEEELSLQGKDLIQVAEFLYAISLTAHTLLTDYQVEPDKSA